MCAQPYSQKSNKAKTNMRKAEACETHCLEFDSFCEAMLFKTASRLPDQL